MMRLRPKKGDKCDNGNDKKALELLREPRSSRILNGSQIMTMPYRKKLIEVALPLNAINKAIAARARAIVIGIERSLGFGQPTAKSRSSATTLRAASSGPASYASSR